MRARVDPGPEAAAGRRNRRIVFIVLAVGLVALGVSGRFDSSRDVELTEDEAIAIAEPYADFEPESTSARLFRQGFRLAPVWGVSMSIADEDDARDLVRLTTVEIDARTGEVLRVSVDEEGMRQRTADIDNGG